MCLKYLPRNTNACGYPTNHAPDKRFELSVSRNELSGMAWSSFPNTLATLSQAGSSATQVKPCPRTLTELHARPPFCRDTGRTEQAARAGAWRAGAMHRADAGSAQAAAGHRAEAGPCGCSPRHCAGVPEPGSSTVSDGSPRDGHLPGPDSLPGPFPCSPRDATASRYQTSPYGKLPTHQSFIWLS